MEDKEAKAKYEALKSEIAANMTKDNSWRNGVMKKTGAEEGAVEPELDIPMHERKPLANMGTDIYGKTGPVAMKYENSSSVVVVSANATANTTAPAATNATAPAATNATATVQVRSRNDTTAPVVIPVDSSAYQTVADYVEARTEAAWMNKQLEDKEARAKYEALKAEVAINMTASNSWRNGVMKVAGTEASATPAEEQKYDIPMHEVKPLANQAANVNGKMGPQALKYENTTAPAASTV